MAFEKAEALILKFPNENILTADTVTCCGRRILPKALNNEDVKYCLKLLSGRRSRVYTSICLKPREAKIRQKTILTALKFKRFSAEEIAAYIKSGEGIGKAGGYSISGKAERFLLWISGSYSSVVGLPAYETTCLLESINIKALS